MVKTLEEIGSILLAKQGENTPFKGEILSQSMEPFLKVGMHLKVKKVNFQAIRVGDIICYRKTNKMISGQKGERLLVHRVIRLDRERQVATAKGDNAARPDTNILPQELIGKAVSFVYKGKEYQFAATRFKLLNRILTFYALLEAYWPFLQTVPKGKKSLTRFICGF